MRQYPDLKKQKQSNFRGGKQKAHGQVGDNATNGKTTARNGLSETITTARYKKKKWKYTVAHHQCEGSSQYSYLT